MKTVAVYMLTLAVVATLANRAGATSRPESTQRTETRSDGCAVTYVMASAPNNEPPVEVAVDICPNGSEPRSPYEARQ